MTMTDNRIIGRDHNNPPVDPHIAMQEEVDILLADMRKKPRKVETAEDEQVITSAVRMIKAKVDYLEEKRVAEKAPILEAGRAIEGFYSEQKTRLEVAKTFFSNALLAHKRAMKEAAEAEAKKKADAQRAQAEKLREEAAKAAERAEKAKSAQQREEAAQQAQRKQAEANRSALLSEQLDAASADIGKQATKSTSANGDKSGLATFDDFRIPDASKVDLIALRDYIPLVVIEKAVRMHMRIHKDRKPIGGVEFFKNDKLRVS
jgi:hypothetical protein